MAVAYYIPDQATLLRRASLQEQQILRARHQAFWRFMLTLIIDLLHQYVQYERQNMGRCRLPRILN
ncbi:cell death protein rpr [Eurosta solidaginis]|uniref:cell death protein rpr n=1 Tax=Eurosta solidaginis TaxID=178769 RepID=UPI0035308355